MLCEKNVLAIGQSIAIKVIGLDALIFTLELWCHENKLCQFHQSSLVHLNDIDNGVGKVSDEGPGDLGVDEAVAHDQDVYECLPKGASVLHLPNSLEFFNVHYSFCRIS